MSLQKVKTEFSLVNHVATKYICFAVTELKLNIDNSTSKQHDLTLTPKGKMPQTIIAEKSSDYGEL